jgi:hypothetical protein
MAKSVPVNEEYDLSIEGSKFLERRSHSEMKRIHRGFYKLNSIGLGPEVREQLESVRPSTVMFEQAIVGDAKEPEAILGGWGKDANSPPRCCEYL